MNNFFKLVISITISELAGVIGSFFTFDSISTWYAYINKPNFSPPNWVFGPVWTTLFALMGIALFLVWKNDNTTYKKKAVSIFFVQLVLNTLWSIIFFGLHSPFGAFIEIILLWIAILFTIIYFAKISKTAGILLLPYIIWVSFAGVLNFFIWQLN